jgi:hypothetical protein
VIVKQQLIIAVGKVIRIFDSTTRVGDRHGVSGFVRVIGAFGNANAAPPLTTFSAKDCFQRHCLFCDCHIRALPPDFSAAHLDARPGKRGSRVEASAAWGITL